MLLSVVPLLFLCAGISAAAKNVTYDRYTGKPATAEQLAKYKSSNITSTCTIDILTCDPKERRRVDASCNNLNNPAMGTFFEPVRRMLPASYSNGSEPRKAADGSELRLPRAIRTALLCEGSSSSRTFTQLMTAWGIWTFGDVASIHDLRKTLDMDCCSAEGRKNNACRPTYVPDDDPTFRYAGIDCLNMTKPILFSDFGCTADTNPSPIQRGTSTFDLSIIYNTLGQGDKTKRTFKDGQFIVDVDAEGIIWPPNGNGYCPANQPGETRCFGQYSTVLLSAMIISMWFMRQHNTFAKKLAELNPCWNDEMLYQTARDMNIAFAYQLYYYEYLPAVTGYDNLVKAGIISEESGFRDLYDDKTSPQVSLEFTYAIRWFHTCQESTANMYAPDGTFLKSYPVTNITFRPGFLDVEGPNGDKNLVLFTQHLYRQPSGKIGYQVQPDIGNRGQAYIQKVFDITANDLHRGRYLGFPPYIHYVQNCTGKTIKSFADLKGHIDEERIDKLKTVYDDVEDIELLAGIWSEKLIKGGSMPATLACIVMDHAKKAIAFDRHWYERRDRPHAFTKKQLKQIRKSKLSYLICNNADKVSVVQPSAFHVISDKNPLTECCDLPTIDFTPWKDANCEMLTTNAESDSTSNTTSEPKYDTTDDTSSDDNSDASADANADASSDGNSDASADANANASSDGNSDASADATADASSDGNSDASADANADASSDNNSEA